MKLPTGAIEHCREIPSRRIKALPRLNCCALPVFCWGGAGASGNGMAVFALFHDRSSTSLLDNAIPFDDGLIDVDPKP
jgi:hypothetical protein